MVPCSESVQIEQDNGIVGSFYQSLGTAYDQCDDPSTKQEVEQYGVMPQVLKTYFNPRKVGDEGHL